MKKKKDFFVQILGHKYKVQHIANMISDHEKMGEADFDAQTLSIDAGLDGKDYWHTLIHEVGHVVFLRSALYHAVDDELEEIIVEQIGRAIVENFSLKVLK